ncbi:MAG: HigA family addiction module antitoxin [Gammaproteobacteria bacterium]|nr:HigA family addiction module antitoxin [Gammaproteobacteria bacterium]
MGLHMATKHKRLEPIHPGEILLDDFMKPLGVSINRLARDVVVPPGRISAIVNGKRAITADTALRLGKYFGVSPGVWMGLQAEHDLRMAQRAIGAEVEKRVQQHAA